MDKPDDAALCARLRSSVEYSLDANHKLHLEAAARIEQLVSERDVMREFIKAADAMRDDLMWKDHERVCKYFDSTRAAIAGSGTGSGG